MTTRKVMRDEKGIYVKFEKNIFRPGLPSFHPKEVQVMQNMRDDVKWRVRVGEKNKAYIPEFRNHSLVLSNNKVKVNTFCHAWDWLKITMTSEHSEIWFMDRSGDNQ